MSNRTLKFKKLRVPHRVVAGLLACGLAHQTARADAEPALSGPAASCEDLARNILSFTKPSANTLSAVCSCTEKRLTQGQGIYEILFDCAGPYAIDHMSEYARIELNGFLRARGLNATQREKFAQCFGAEFWRRTNQFSESGLRPGRNDAEAMSGFCLVKSTGTRPTPETPLQQRQTPTPSISR